MTTTDWTKCRDKDQESFDRSNAERNVNWRRAAPANDQERAEREQEVQAEMQRMRFQRANDERR